MSALVCTTLAGQRFRTSRTNGFVVGNHRAREHRYDLQRMNSLLGTRSASSSPLQSCERDAQRDRARLVMGRAGSAGTTLQALTPPWLQERQSASCASWRSDTVTCRCAVHHGLAQGREAKTAPDPRGFGQRQTRWAAVLSSSRYGARTRLGMVGARVPMIRVKDPALLAESRVGRNCGASPIPPKRRKSCCDRLCYSQELVATAAWQAAGQP